jgi:hypothetical protein
MGAGTQAAGCASGPHRYAAVRTTATSQPRGGGTWDGREGTALTRLANSECRAAPAHRPRGGQRAGGNDNGSWLRHPPGGPRPALRPGRVSASEANDTGRRGGGAPVTHVGTIARHRRAANKGQRGDGRGDGRAPQQGGSRPLTAMRRSPPRHSSREAARRAGGNDTGQAGDTEATCNGSGGREAEGNNCEGTRGRRGVGHTGRGQLPGIRAWGEAASAGGHRL